MKRYRLFIFISIIILLFGYGGWKFMNFLELKKKNFNNFTYQLEALSLQERVKSEILQKQESTTDIAFSVANNQDLKEKIINGNIPQDYHDGLVEGLKNSKLYKNIWIQVIDKNGISIHRSWTKKKNDSLVGIRKDLEEVILTKKTEHSISIGKFDLSFKSIIPLFEKKKFIGIVEVISHFNSITKKLHKLGIDSVVVAKKEYKKQLKYPFTKLFIGDYYVANFDAPLVLRNYLKTHGIEKYFNNSYKVENGYFIVSYPLKNKKLRTIGYFIIFKKLNTISNKDLDFFIFKWFSLIAIIFMFLILIISTTLFFINRRQKEYYRRIIDSSSDVMTVNNMKTILSANKAFFKLFDRYNSLEEFLVDNKCICDFFVKEDGYIQKEMNGLKWVEYLLKYSNKKHIVKINFYGKNHYFIISASLILEKSNHYSIVLSEITEQEEYKKKLEVVIITDGLTGIKTTSSLKPASPATSWYSRLRVPPVGVALLSPGL